MPYVKPHTVIGTESKLGRDVLDSEVFPEGHFLYRKDSKQGGGCVFVAREINWELQTLSDNYNNPRMCKDLIQMVTITAMLKEDMSMKDNEQYCKYCKSKRQDNIGISPLKYNGRAAV